MSSADIDRPVLGAVWTISAKKTVLGEPLLDAYAYLGIEPECAPVDVTAPTAFTDAGYTTLDAIGTLAALQRLVRDPEAYQAHVIGGRSQNSEGVPVEVYLVSSTHMSELDRVEAMHAVWPRVFSILGFELSCVRIHESDEHSTFSTKETLFKVPKAIRLKSGWDYDGAGNRIWLSLDEAWRRFERHVRDTMSDSDLARMRSHMEDAYTDRAKTTDA